MDVLTLCKLFGMNRRDNVCKKYVFGAGSGGKHAGLVFLTMLLRNIIENEIFVIEILYCHFKNGYHQVDDDE